VLRSHFLDSFQAIGCSLESLEKTIFSFASSAALTYPMDNLTRERSFIP
jgi:hypothetical protein